MSQVYYLFCLTPADAAAPAVERAGIDGRSPVFIERFHEVAAVLCETALEEFVGADAEKRLQDLSWVGPRAYRHEEIILTFSRQGPVLPVRFGTVFSSREHMMATLGTHLEKIAEFLRYIADKEEWTLKGLMNRPAVRTYVMTQRLAQAADDLTALSPGKRYFAEQRLKLAVDKDLQLWLREGTREAIKRLSAISMGFSQRRLIARDVTGSEEEMFFNGAFLVPKVSLDRLEGAVLELNAEGQDRGLRYDLTGPWPPYSFAPALDEETS